MAMTAALSSGVKAISSGNQCLSTCSAIASKCSSVTPISESLEGSPSDVKNSAVRSMALRAVSMISAFASSPHTLTPYCAKRGAVFSFKVCRIQRGVMTASPAPWVMSV